MTEPKKKVEKKEAPKTPDQSESVVPKAPAGKKAIWHKPYSYTNKQGTTIQIRGHWEMANLPKEKPKAAEPTEETKVEEKVEEEGEGGGEG